MLNVIWFAIILCSIIGSFFTGRVDQLSQGVMDGAKDAVELALVLLGSMCAWMGFLKIAEESGLTDALAKVLSPVISFLFPEYRGDREIQGKISMNISANLLGLGNAATPLGLSAMSAMANKAGNTGIPTKGMVLFVVMNTASLQLLPVNMAAMRASCGSAQPFNILPQIWITSLAALITSVTVCKLWEGGTKWRN